MAMISKKIEDFDEPQKRSLSDLMFGRYMLPDRTEFSCQIKDLSPESATFTCDECPMMGEHIIAYIAEIGRVEGEVTKSYGTSFTLRFNIPNVKREKIADKLQWLKSREDNDLPEQRRHPRHEPRETKTVLILSDGRTYNCEILDISVSGAAVKAPIIPSIGTEVTLGKTRGTVMRVLKNGVGIQFNRKLAEPELAERIN